MRKILLTIILGMFLISFASSCDSLYKLDQEIELKVICINSETNSYCSNSSYCNVNIEYPNSSLLIQGQNMTNQITFHNISITNDLNGEYSVGGICVDGDNSEPIDFCYNVTTNGNIMSLSSSIIRIFLIIFFMSLFALYYKMNEKINYDKWYNSLVQKYSKKNGVKTILWGMAYFVIKNKGINSYLIGFPIVLLLYQIIVDYNIDTIVMLFETIVFLYSYGIIIMGISWFGRLWEFVNMMRSDIGEEMWGVRR